MVTIRPFGEHVENIKSLEEGLQEYFKSELLDGENQYFCERCNAKCGQFSTGESRFPISPDS